MALALKEYLTDINNRLIPREEERLQAEWRLWAEHKNTGGPFSPAPRTARPSALTWPSVNINDTLTDDDLSVYSELYGIHTYLEQGGNTLMRMRVNTGVGNVASAFGAPRFVMPRETNTLPNVRPIGFDRLTDFLSKPLPPVTAGNFETIFRISERFQQIQKDYENIRAYVHIEQPDLQGPIDNLELLWGSDMFYALYDEPETVLALLGMLTDFMRRYMHIFLEMFPRGTANYFRHFDKGAIAVRVDSAMNLSPEFYEKFVFPFDARLLGEFGGIVHFCGKGDHFIEKLSAMPGLSGVNMSQPELNNMEKILAAIPDRDIHLSVPPVALGSHKAENVFFWQ